MDANGLGATRSRPAQEAGVLCTNVSIGLTLTAPLTALQSSWLGGSKAPWKLTEVCETGSLQRLINEHLFLGNNPPSTLHLPPWSPLLASIAPTSPKKWRVKGSARGDVLGRVRGETSTGREGKLKNWKSWIITLRVERVKGWGNHKEQPTGLNMSGHDERPYSRVFTFLSCPSSPISTSDILALLFTFPISYSSILTERITQQWASGIEGKITNFSDCRGTSFFSLYLQIQSDTWEVCPCHRMKSVCTRVHVRERSGFLRLCGVCDAA